MGILALKVHFEQDDPFWIANAQYYLKKVSKEKIFLESVPSETTMLQISKALVSELSAVSALTFFYYANPDTERVNLFTYLETEAKDDYKEELFYLRRCYGEGFLYMEDEALDAKEIYVSSPNKIWGISPEAVVCLACPDKGRKTFIQGTFYRNFNFILAILIMAGFVIKNLAASKKKTAAPKGNKQRATRR